LEVGYAHARQLVDCHLPLSSCFYVDYFSVLKLCVLNINVSLQFADTIILNVGAQLVRRASL